ncbi:MAG: amidohydrolase [Clostridiaceae bacterium]
MDIKELAKQYHDYAVTTRRWFHMNPEPSRKEYNTAEKVEEELRKLGLEPKRVAETGVVAYIDSGKPGKTIGLRADMDALEVTELNECTYKSTKTGLMHACGHDGHMAGLLTAAKILNDMKGEFSGKVKLIFQPAEEIAWGAKAIIAAGELKDVDAMFGIHLWNDIDVGQISLEPGPRLSSATMFKIKIQGKGGHGALPNQGVDSVVVASDIIMNLQSIVSREIDPTMTAVITCGTVDAGTRFNIIADTAEITGTTRCFTLETNAIFEPAMRRIVENTAKIYRATAELEYNIAMGPTVNHKELSIQGKKGMIELFGESVVSDFGVSSIGEDFAYYGLEVPSVFALVGTRKKNKEESFPHHHANFDIDEDGMYYSSALYAKFAFDYLKEGEQ